MSVANACLSTAVRAVNRSDRVLRGLGQRLPDLRPDVLLRSASRHTGLLDLGLPAICEPLERLVHALEREARLTLLGRLTVRRHLVSLLETLLQLQQERTMSPAVSEQRITAPVFIVGLPRTGTTLLHNLLVQDPGIRAPLTWETMFPAGYPESPQALRRARSKAAAQLDWLHRFAPEFKHIHPVGAERPEECVALMAPTFTSALFYSLYRVPSYQDWYESDEQTLGYEMHFRVLQQLQQRRGKGRWVLKGPAHLFGLEALLRRYPDARLIQTHRDPLRAIPSIASLNTTLRNAFSHPVDPEEIGMDCAARLSGALDRFLRKRDTLPTNRFVDVAYAELTDSPMSTVERLYDHLGWPLSATARAAMQGYLARNPKDACGVHRYSLQSFGLDAGQEAKRFARYCTRFDVRREADPEFSVNRQES